MTAEFSVNEDCPPIRADIYLTERIGVMSRSQLKSRFKEIHINNAISKLSKIVRPGDIIVLIYEEGINSNILPENIPLKIIFENDDCAVIDKPRGMVVHPAYGHHNGTLAQGLAFYLGDRSSMEKSFRAGIVHRLDKDTSGIIITAKNAESHEFLAKQFKLKTCQKTYLAIAKGLVYPKKGVINTFLKRDEKNRKKFTVDSGKGKKAVTDYEVIRCFKKHSLLKLKPRTGRTHQLRVHMKSIGHPILGDPIYSRSSPDDGGAPLMLHAYKLSIKLPGMTELSVFRANLPEDFKSRLLRLAKDSSER